MLALLASIPLLVPQNPAPPVDWAELMRRFQADAAALGKAGAPLDLAALKLENLEPGEIARENGKRETEYFGESWFEMLWVLSRSFGLEVDATADAFRVSFLRLSSDSLAAWYLPARKSIVIDEAHYTTDARLDRALLHALALAYLDQQPGGLAALRRAGSTDELLASRGWIEGRAELCARRAGGAGPRASLVAFEERTGGFTLVDLAGQSEAARQELLPEAQRALPANSAALLHGRARPTTATLGIEGLAPLGAKLLRGTRWASSACASCSRWPVRTPCARSSRASGSRPTGCACGSTASASASSSGASASTARAMPWSSSSCSASSRAARDCAGGT